MTERKQYKFAHAKIEEHMKKFGVKGFDAGVKEVMEHFLLYILKDVTSYSLFFRDHDNRVRTSLYDIFMSLIFKYKDHIKDTIESIKSTDQIKEGKREKILDAYNQYKPLIKKT